MRRSVSSIDVSAADRDTSDDGSHIVGVVEKKRRLSADQVRVLERSFESGTRLEPERRTELARGLGLEPRQISVWFQNRRARWKAKQLERDYEVLKRELQEIRARNDALKTHNNRLISQISAMRIRERVLFPAAEHGVVMPEILRGGFSDEMFGGVEEKYEFWPWTEEEQ